QVRFNIPGIAPHTIYPQSRYNILNPLIIDGSTQPANGYTGSAPKIALDGNHVVDVCFAFGNSNYITPFSTATYGCNIHGFGTGISHGDVTSATVGAPNKRNVIHDNGNGIAFTECRNITVENNYIGTDTSGMSASGNSGWGIYLINDSNALIKNNLVSGNQWGIHLLSDSV